MILELKGIYKDYIQGKMTVPVLKDVNFSWRKANMWRSWGLRFRKTTLMNIIGCLDQATKGSFFWTGRISVPVRKTPCRISG